MKIFPETVLRGARASLRLLLHARCPRSTRSKTRSLSDTPVFIPFKNMFVTFTGPKKNHMSKLLLGIENKSHSNVR